MSKGLKVIGAIALLIAVIGGGFWYVNKKQEAVNKEQPETVKQQEGAEVQNDSQQEEKQVVKEDNEKRNDENVEELKVEDIDTSNWKTYRNEEFGFEVKLPDGWESKYINEYNKDWGVKNSYLSVTKGDNTQNLVLYVWKIGESFSSGRSGISAGDFISQKDIYIDNINIEINSLVQNNIVKEVVFNGRNDKYEVGGYFSCIKNSEVSYGCIGENELSSIRKIISSLKIK